MTEKQIAFPCPACERDRFSLLHKTRGGPTAFNHNKAAFYICDGCGLVIRYPRPAAAELLEEFYKVEYWEEQNITQRQLFNVAESTRKRVEEFLQAVDEDWSEGMVVDVGCGFGDMAATLADLLPECKIIGLEPSVEVAQTLRDCNSRANVEIVTGSLDSFQYGGNGRIRAVFLSHVFEHILDPVAALVKLREMLAPGGWLFIEVPDVMEPGVFGLDYFFRDFHLFYYSENTLSSLLTRTEFEVKAVKRGGAFRITTAPTLCLIAKRPNDSTALVSTAIRSRPESQRVRTRINAVRDQTRFTGPLRFIYRYRVKRRLMKRLGVVKSFLTSNG